MNIFLRSASCLIAISAGIAVILRATLSAEPDVMMIDFLVAVSLFSIATYQGAQLHDIWRSTHARAAANRTPPSKR